MFSTTNIGSIISSGIVNETTLVLLWEIMYGIGAQTYILPGVTIGDNTVVTAGSVINKNIPANVIAVENSCCVIRKITEKDKTKYRL